MKSFMRSLVCNLRKFAKNTKPQEKAQEKFFTKDILTADNIQIGDYTYGLPTVLHWGENSRLEIGKYCSISSDVKIFLGGNHRIDWITTYPFNSVKIFTKEAYNIKGHPATKGDVLVGNDVWIGWGAVILSGVKVGSGAVIAAYSVVTKDIQPYEIVGGNPAKHIRYRFDKNNIDLLLKSEWWSLPEEKIKQLIPFLSSGDIDMFCQKLNNI